MNFCRVAEQLVKANQECVKWKENNDQTPLHRVCDNSNSVRVVKLFIDNEADLNAQ